MRKSVITPSGYTQEKVYFPRRGNSPNFDFPHMRIYTYNCEFPLVEMHPKMCLSAVRIYTFCGDTQFNVNVHMWKSVFPRTRICTVLSEFPHVEIHKSMCKSAPRKYAFPHVEIHMRSCISACGNTPKIVNFPTCGNTHFLMYFHMRKFERESEFRHVSLQADLWISAGKNVWEYTFFCWFPRMCEFQRVEIHAERYQVQIGTDTLVCSYQLLPQAC